MKRDQRNPRKSISANAWVTLEGGFAKRCCTVLDISDTGARVQFPGEPPATTIFNLSLTGDATSTRRCRVVWQKQRVAGLQFTRAAKT